MKKLIVLANCPVASDSMGGGDRIMIETFRRLSKTYSVELWGCQEAIEMAQKNGFNPPHQQVTHIQARSVGTLIAYFLRMIENFFYFPPLPENSLVYSASEVLPDLVGPLKAKLFGKKFKWVVGLYLMLENPLKRKNLTYRGSFLNWLGQQISIWFLKRFANMIWVLDKRDIGRLSKRGVNKNKVIKIHGGIDYESFQKIRPNKKISYDGLFVGRFHPQKGLTDLILAWKEVVKILPQAKLGIIGWGSPLQTRHLGQLIHQNQLNQNINLLGFLDRKDKIAILKGSKLLIFPSHHESWGVVGLEGLAAGVPVVAYDLPAFKDTYGRALIKVKRGDIKALSQKIKELLQNPRLRKKWSLRGGQIAKRFDWKIQAKKAQRHLAKLLHFVQDK